MSEEEAAAFDREEDLRREKAVADLRESTKRAEEEAATEAKKRGAKRKKPWEMEE